jgi:hypothetical protein
MSEQRNVETMAEQWQRQKPATYGRTHYDGKQDSGITEFTEQLAKIDPFFTLKLVDDGMGFDIRFSDGSSYRLNL